MRSRPSLAVSKAPLADRWPALWRRAAPHGVPAAAREGHRFLDASDLVRGGKGDRDRVTMLPAHWCAPSSSHLERRREQHMAELRRGSGRSWYPMTSLTSARAPPANGAGNSCSRLATTQDLRARTGRSAGTCPKNRSSTRCDTPSNAQASTNPLAATPCATASQPTYCSAAKTSARFSNCWGTRMSARQCSIPMSRAWA